jgi:periplasmic protein CpxP/Spy
MYKFIKFITPLTLSVGLILSATVNAAPMEHNKPDLHHILAQLDLSQQQRQDIRQLLKDGRADIEIFRQDRQQFRQQLHSLIQSPNWDATAATILLNEQQEFKGQADLQRALSKHKMLLILEPEQQSKLITLLGQDKPKQKRDAEDMQLLNKLNLTSEQQSLLGKLMADMQANREQMSTKHQAFAEAERTLINAQEFDNAQWQALHASFQTENLAMVLSNVENRNKVWNLLNDEQQQQLVELLKASKKDRKHHHGEDMVAPLEI